MNIGILIDVVVICLVGWLFYWLITYLAPPDPVKKIAVVVLVVVLVIALVGLLAGVSGPRTLILR